MRVGLLTREYPPEVYGGAGVHVEHLAAALSSRVEVAVHCFGAPRDDPLVAGTYGPWSRLDGPEPHLAALRTLSTDLAMVAGVSGVDLVHSHTWYANLAGHLSSLTYDVPHVMTTHSLEPLRPWKREQLGGGYELSSFCERTAVLGADAIVAVSDGMRRDVLASYPAVDPGRVHVIHNGIDPATYRRTSAPDVPTRLGVDPDRRTVLFVGRITRQKGLTHLLDAAHHLPRDVQLVLCAGQPDTEALADEVRDHVERLAADRDGIVWIERALPRPDVVALLSHTDVFVCPSIYEPFGLVNLEAMACGAPVVATATGGIPEIVVDGETGLLVPYEGDAEGPTDPARFARDLAAALTRVLDDPDGARAMGAAGRERVLADFTWDAVADRTADLYRSLV